LRAQRGRRRALQADGLLRPRPRPQHRVERPRYRDRLAAAGGSADHLGARRRRAVLGGGRRRAAVPMASLEPMPPQLRERTSGFTVPASQCGVTARVALGMLTLIVPPGAAVRLPGPGLGCPTCPRCYGNYSPPLNAHSVIEF